MKINDFVMLILRNAVYIVLGLIMGAGIGALVSKYQTPVYEASTKIYVSRARQQGTTDILSLSNEQLLAINLQMAKSQPVLKEVSSQLGSKIDADNIFVEVVPNTLIIQIKVQDQDAQRASTIANLLVENLIQQNEKLLGDFYTGFETAINDQLEPAQKQIESLQDQISQIKTADIQNQLVQVERQITQIKTEITDLEKEIAKYPTNPASTDLITLAEKQAQLDQLRSLMTLYQQIQTNLTYSGKPGQNDSSLENPLLSTLQSTLNIYQQINVALINDRENTRLAREQSKQNVKQIVSAIEPKTPTRPIPVLYVLMGGGVGLALIVMAVMIIDHMDNSLRFAGQIEELLGLPVLGSVYETKKTGNELVAILKPYSTDADGFRALGANLEIIGMGKNIRTLLVANAEPSAGRTAIAANLAIIHAQQGKTVILLDGDLKVPHLHKLFEMENQIGFAELLAGNTLLAIHKVKDVDGLSLIPSGNLEKGAMGWLDPEKLTQVLSSLQQYADLVIVDSPPTGVADAQVLASKVDSVLLAISAGETRARSVETTLRKFKLINAKMTGSVFFRTRRFRKINFHFKNKTQ